MKYIMTTVTIAIFFSACSTMTPIQKASDSESQFGGGIYTGTQEKGVENKSDNEEYRVFHRGASSFTPLFAVRESVEKRADKFCEAKGKARVTTSEKHSNPPHILGNWPRIELIFICKDKNTSPVSTTNKYDQLAKLKKLLDNKTITQEEFNIEKAKILK